MRCHKYTPKLLGCLALLGLAGWGASAQTLTHRYSFGDTAGSASFADSVGGATGTLNNSTAANPNSAYLDGAELVLDGQGGYANLPANLVSGYTNLTVEFWVDVSASNPLWTRLFSFGDQNGNIKNSGLDFCPYAQGDYQNLDLADTNGVGAYANSSPSLLGRTNVHVTVVVDPANNKLLYYNGSVAVSTEHNAIPAFTDINDAYNLIGRSLFDVDPTANAVFHEFRIYTGPFSSRQVALNDAAGPTKLITDPGPVQALHFSAPANPLTLNQISQQVLTGDFTNLTGLDLIAYGGATFSSLNTGVVTINSNGVVKALALGTAKVVASFGGVSATNTLTVVPAPVTLAHRYSFNSGDASDSVGGANGTLMGTASVSGGQLVLDGNPGSYVDLPGGVINIATNSAVSFDAWVTFGPATHWAYLFGFGNTNNGGGVGQIACVPCSDGTAFYHWGITENFGGGQTPTWPHPWANMTAHITCVVDPPTSTISVYRDGVLEQAVYNASAALSNVPTNYAFLGRSFYDADPYLPASIDEFRIYSGALTPAQVALVHKNGPNNTTFDPGALVSITVAPTNYPAYASLVPPVILANYANFSGFNMLANSFATANAAFNGLQGLVVTSSDTNIVSVNAQNMLTTHRPGMVTLTATYGGKTNSGVITVRNQAVLTHRWSFNVDGDASDSVGGAIGNLIGAATVSGGQLQLTGNNGDYLDLPPGLLSNYTAVTVDAWANLGAAQHWARLWEFADVDGNPNDNRNEFYFAPAWGGTPNADSYSAGFSYGGSFTSSGPLQNAPYHITCVYGDGTMQLYTNGVFQAGIGNLVGPVSNAGLVSSTIGHSPYNDPGIFGSVDEFRIYQGRLGPDEILASDVLGPNQTLSTGPAPLTVKLSGGNVVLSWPVANAGFAVQSSSSLRSPSWLTLTNAPSIVGNTTWQLALPVSGSAQFFRLTR